jgi:small subunit ribosomal protein S17
METKPKFSRKSFTGMVISAKMKKTIVVEVRTTVMHPKYRKFVRRRHRFMAHDEHSTCHPGDRVVIVESRPISKTKRWRVSKVLAQGAGEK